MHGHRVELGATEVITPVKRLWWNLVRVRVRGRVRDHSCEAPLLAPG